MSYHVFFENRGFFIALKGLTTIAEINESNGQIQGHKNFDTHKYQICNLLDADLSEITESEIVLPAATDWAASKTRNNIKVAFVVRDNHAIKICETYIFQSKKMGSPWSFGIFQDFDGAMEWVDN